MSFYKLLFISTVLGLSLLHASSYTVDKTHSSVGFKVKHMMISNVRGSFSDFKGEFVIDEKTKQFSALSGKVMVESITTKDQKRDNHLKSPDFFDVKKFPLMSLKLLEHNGESGKFELTIKDVTKVVTLEIEEISDTVKDPWGYTRVAFELHGKINRKDFNMNFNQLLETGGLLVDDMVKFDIFIEGIQNK